MGNNVAKNWYHTKPSFVFLFCLYFKQCLIFKIIKGFILKPSVKQLCKLAIKFKSFLAELNKKANHISYLASDTVYLRQLNVLLPQFQVVKLMLFMLCNCFHRCWNINGLCKTCRNGLLKM